LPVAKVNAETRSIKKEKKNRWQKGKEKTGTVRKKEEQSRKKISDRKVQKGNAGEREKKKRMMRTERYQSSPEERQVKIVYQGSE